MDDRYARYKRLALDRPHPRVLRVTMNRPDKYNAADAEMHREMTEIWRDGDGDSSVNAVLLTGSPAPARRSRRAAISASSSG